MSLSQADPQRTPGSGWGRYPSLFRPLAEDPLPLLEQKIHLVYARLPWGLAMNLVVSAALTFGLYGPYRRQMVWYWLAATFLLNVLRFMDYRDYARQPAAEGTLAGHHRNLILGAGVQGLLWGIAGTLFFPSAPADQVLLFGVLFGMAAGAVRYLSALWPVFLWYLLPALVPPSLRLIFGEGLSQHLIGFLGLVYTVAMVAASSATSQWIDHSLKATQDLDDLSAQLRSANTDRKRSGPPSGCLTLPHRKAGEDANEYGVLSAPD